MSFFGLYNKSFRATAQEGNTPLHGAGVGTILPRMEKITCAIVGFGGMGHHHASRYALCKNVRLVALCDIDPARLATAESETNLGASGSVDLKSVRLYSDYASLARAERGRIDMLDLCLPTHLHARIAARALRDGFHVLGEKPMARTLRDCERMLDAARDSGRILMTAQCLRFSPLYAELARMIRERPYGELLRLEMRRFGGTPTKEWYRDHRKSGGALLDLQLHDLDFALSVFGTPTSLRTEALRGESGGWDESLTRLRFPGTRALVTIQGGWLRPVPFQWGFTAVFERACLQAGGSGTTLVDPNGHPLPLSIPDGDMYATEIDYFADCVRRGIRPERCLPESTRESIRIVMAEMRSAAHGGTWIGIR